MVALGDRWEEYLREGLEGGWDMTLESTVSHVVNSLDIVKVGAQISEMESKAILRDNLALGVRSS